MEKAIYYEKWLGLVQVVFKVLATPNGKGVV